MIDTLHNALVHYSWNKFTSSHAIYYWEVSICWNCFDNIRYYTGYPKDLGPSRVIHFTSEREFVNLLHEGFPVVVAFTIRWSGWNLLLNTLTMKLIYVWMKKKSNTNWFKNNFLLFNNAGGITQNILTKY